MSNTSSAKKECRKSAKRRHVNINVNSRVKTFVKKILVLIADHKKKEALDLFPLVQSELMKAVTKGILKHNTASRKVSSIAQKIKVLA